MAKKLVIGNQEWSIPDATAEAIALQVRDAMLNGRSVALELNDADGRAVTVYLNGAATSSVVLDLDRGPRPPSEMS
ncbi:hypothetical protein [Micromonospora sp. WMMD987]|uniref:hypothetical protein n=1 Tax=Micromonospora sp. WMMD987 TaxID=3016089 RepID=UPI00249A6C63|nr:hypothetical protein [Micromonospora sp. WMMD987]WFE95383.1 hypothetical protein O7612_00090 [Micromonospora sp. WMMD987]